MKRRRQPGHRSDRIDKQLHGGGPNRVICEGRKALRQRMHIGRLLLVVVTICCCATSGVFAAAGFADMARTQTAWLGDNYALMYHPPENPGLVQHGYLGTLSLWRARKATAGEIGFPGDVMPQDIVLKDVTGIAFPDAEKVLFRVSSGDIYCAAISDVGQTLHNSVPDDLASVAFMSFEEYQSSVRQRFLAKACIVVLTSSIAAIMFWRWQGMKRLGRLIRDRRLARFRT